jgi:UDP-GlcNAc:undecaprenyl-phosphate/decaprenyl-phosphate GlcNAc-1-phosphate transferase
LPGFGVLAAIAFAALLAWAGARMLAVDFGRRERALDQLSDSMRKLHAMPTPRVGGIAVLLGMLGGAAIDCVFGGRMYPWMILLACVSPAFVWGLIEDVYSRGAVLPRLVLPAVAGALGFILLDARLTQLGLPVVDDLLAIHALAFIFTLFAVTGVTHALNVIDGLNGLAGVNAVLAAVGLAVVAALVGDQFVLSVACVLAASVAGFLVINYPSGRIFLGDGGAYLVGLLLAELSVLLVQRNSEVSPWFPLMLLAYPIWETLFSMYRRKLRGYSTAHADGLHLHQLVYRRLVRWRGFSSIAADQVARNSVASICLWPLPLGCFLTAVALWRQSLALQVAAVGFVILYCAIYRALVRFRLPEWAILRARSTVAEADITEPARMGR